MTKALQQRRVLFEGDVQGVGFRYTTHRLATGMAVTGFVKNLPDGRVELIAEGAAEEIDGLLAGIREHLGGNIRSELADSVPRTGRYTSFEIRH